MWSVEDKSALRVGYERSHNLFMSHEIVIFSVIFGDDSIEDRRNLI
jgi:hypothetical protein